MRLLDIGRAISDRTVLAIVLLFFAAVVQAQTTTEYTPVPAPAFTAEQLTALPTNNWAANGGNLANQRFSPKPIRI